jgi:hypothetical protein
MVMDEPSPNNLASCGLTSSEWASINIPYLITEGSPVIGPAQIPLFNGTVNALPRYDVHIPNMAHIGSQTGNCDLIDQAREVSFSRQLAANTNAILQDPLLGNVASSLDGGAGASAFVLWNLDTISSALGAGRQYCSHVGIHSQYISTDADQDGLTDMPPFGCTGSISNVCSTFSTPIQVPEQQLNKYLFTYTVSMFKVYLDNDPRYKHFLTEDWTSENFPGITITPVGVNKNN